MPSSNAAMEGGLESILMVVVCLLNSQKKLRWQTTRCQFSPLTTRSNLYLFFNTYVLYVKVPKVLESTG